MDEVQFFTWVDELTKGSSFPRQKLPSHSQLSSLLSVKSFTPVLEYLVKHARPSEECHHIKLNLRNYYRRKHLSEEKRISEADGKISQLRLQIHEAEKEVEIEASELKRRVEEVEKLSIDDDDCRCHLSLLKISCGERESKMKKMKDQTKAISQLLPKPKPLLSPQEESIKLKLAMEDLEVILQDLRNLKRNLLTGQKDFHKNKMDIWKSVEELIECYSATTLSRAISSKLSQDTDRILDAVNAVNLKDDAKSLNLEYLSNGVFVDVLNPHGILETVESMLVQMSAKHIEKHLSYCKQEKKVKLASESLTNVSSNIRSMLKEQYKDSSLVLAIMDLFKTTVRVAGLKASLSTALSLNTDLEKRVEVAKKGRDSITEKYNRIHNFEDNMKHTITELQTLVFASHNSLNELEMQRSITSSLVDNKLKDLVLPTPFLKGAFSKECEAIVEIPDRPLKNFPSMYFSFPGRSVGPVEDLQSGLTNLSCIVPFLSPWEHIIETIRQKKLQLNINENILSNESKDLEVMTRKSLHEHLSVYEVKAIQQKVNLHDEQLEAEISPVLEKCEEINKDVEDTLSRLKISIDYWGTQPGPELKNYIEEKYKKSF